MTLGNCHICTRMTQEGRKHAGKQPAKGAEFCRLCKRPYCLAHKSTTETEKEVCEINHFTYAAKHPREVGNGWKIFADMKIRKNELGDEGLKEEEEKIKEMVESLVNESDSV